MANRNKRQHMNSLDELASMDSFIHRLHPASKVITTICYLLLVISYQRYEIIRLTPLLIYPVVVIALSDLPLGNLMKRLALIEPFIIGIGILNPIFDHNMIYIGNHVVSVGWLSFMSILIKSAYTIFAGLILVATTGIDRLAIAMQWLKMPKVLILQILLTYRYIAVLIEEVTTMLIAYKMRASGQKHIKIEHMGGFIGQLLIRTLSKAQNVYRAMRLRGFEGTFVSGGNIRFKKKDYLYVASWNVFFLVAYFLDLPQIIESLIMRK